MNGVMSMLLTVIIALMCIFTIVVVVSVLVLFIGAAMMTVKNIIDDLKSYTL